MGMVIQVDEILNIFDQRGCMKGDLLKINLRWYPDVLHYDSKMNTISNSTKGKIELEWLESDCIYVKVTQPTDWCVPIVPKKEKNDHKSFCID